MTDGNDEYALAQTPQEWKWLLQDEGLLEPIVTEEGDENVAAALDWLHKSTSTDLLLSKGRLERATKQCQATRQRVAAYQRILQNQKQQHRQLLRDELSSVVNSTHTRTHEHVMDIVISCTTTTKAELEAAITNYMNETVEPTCLNHVQRAWNDHKSALGEIWRQYQQTVETQNVTPAQDLLPKLLVDDDSSSTIDSLEIYQALLNELRELQAFYSTRARFQKSVPSFLQTACLEQVEEHDAMLNDVLRDITGAPAQRLWTWWGKDTSHRGEWMDHVLHNQESLRATTVLLEESREEVRQQEVHIEKLQTEVEKYQSRIESAKNKLQEKITKLFDFEDMIEIVI